MILPRRKPPLTLILVVLMLILLPILAYKQYEWLGKVSASDREQMRAVMTRSATQFREDFDREITRIHESFQTDAAPVSRPEELNPQLRKLYPELYRNWIRSAPYPKLISDLFMVVPGSNGVPGLERFNLVSSEFESTEWPPELLGLRDSSQLMSRMMSNTAAGRLLNIPRSFDSKIPAVIVTRIIGSSTSTIVLKLNLDFIQKEFIPLLVRQDLSTGNGAPDFNISVVDTAEPKRVIYSSTGSSSAVLNGDVKMGIFMPEPAMRGAATLRSFAFGTMADIVQKHVETDGPGVTVKIQSNGARSGPIVATSIFETRTSNPSWQLVLQDRSGSVDVAVGEARRRNLAISFSILLLLALSVGLIVMSAQRERRLAQQQMEFVSTVSHELRTPLAVICSAAENLADGVVHDGDQTRQYGALVRNEGRRLADMVEQILDFAGFQSGKRVLRQEVADVADIIDRALETFEMQIRDSGVVVEKRIAPGLPPIMADSPALIRAVQNLISNGLKYGQPANWLSVRAEAAADSVHIVVEDHGGGISPDDLPHIFEPFYRGRAVVDAQIKGSGLGLSLVKQIVESHHAKISVHSDPASGSVFTIALPIRGSNANFVGSHDQAYSSR